MPLPIIGSVIDLAKDLIERVIPDPKAKADALLKLRELEQSGDLQAMAGQVEVNKVEAASPNVFIAGWRPAVGWVLATGLAVVLVVGPLLSWGSTLAGHPVKPPEMPTDVLVTLSTSLLGLAGMRSWEKFKGVEGNRS
jgi:hypothetical protein